MTQLLNSQHLDDGARCELQAGRGLVGGPGFGQPLREVLDQLGSPDFRWSDEQSQDWIYRNDRIVVTAVEGEVVRCAAFADNSRLDGVNPWRCEEESVIAALSRSHGSRWFVRDRGSSREYRNPNGLRLVYSSDLLFSIAATAESPSRPGPPEMEIRAMPGELVRIPHQDWRHGVLTREGLDDCRLGWTRSNVHARLGPPQKSRRDEHGVYDQYDHGGLTLCFDDTSTPPILSSVDVRDNRALLDGRNPWNQRWEPTNEEIYFENPPIQSVLFEQDGYLMELSWGTLDVIQVCH